jgi:2-polyprenyl-3-methyl-5-hydroxy-6-metoxy-1,4-benzoquinol methylase
MATAGSSLPARPGRKNATGYETGSNDTGLMAIFTETWSGKFRGHDVRQRRIELLNRQYTFIGPCAPEALLDAPNAEARFAADGYMPYWAEFWPASLLLMDAVASWAPPGPGAPPVKVLELGCGLGAVSVVLGSLGYRVFASDYDGDALAFTMENARINGVTTIEPLLIDWREAYPGLRVDRIVAAEVLYECRNAEPVAQFVSRHLSPTGFALICDRNRSTADDFPEVARRFGMQVEVSAVQRGDPDGGRPISGRLFRLELREL